MESIRLRGSHLPAATLSNSDANLTVLAPTNAAFTAALAELMMTPAEALASPVLAPLLEYHVIAGAAMVIFLTMPFTPCYALSPLHLPTK